MHILIYLIDLILSWEQGPPDPRLLPCEIQPAKKRKSTPPGSLSILGRLGNLGRLLSSCARNAAKCSSCRGWHWHIWSLCRDTRLCGCMAGASGLSIIGWSAPIKTVASLYRSTIKFGSLFKNKKREIHHILPQSPGDCRRTWVEDSRVLYGVWSTVNIRCRVPGDDDSSGWWSHKGIWGDPSHFRASCFYTGWPVDCVFRVTTWLQKN